MSKKRTPEGAGDGNDPPADPNARTMRVKDLRPKLARFGLDPTNADINGWNTSQAANVERALHNWVQEYDFAQAGKEQAKADRWPMPDLLKPYEKLPPDLATGAQAMGQEAAKTGRTAETNPYPLDSAIAEMWLVGFKSFVPPAATPAKPPEPANAAAAATPAGTNQPAKPPEKTAADKEREAQEEREARIAAFRATLEDELSAASQDADEAEDDWNQAKATVKSRKATFDECMGVVRQRSRDLRRIREGTYEFQQTFFDPPKGKKDKPKSDAPLPNTDTPDVPVVDEGSRFDLLTFVKGTLQKTTGCAEGLGLGKTQVEKLKEAVNGSTVFHLEKFQRETFNWDTAIKGFGPAAITTLQDAQLAFRTKFPQPPTPDKPDKKRPTGAKEVDPKDIKDGPRAPKKEPAPKSSKMTNAQAIKALDSIIIKCGEVCAHTSVQAAKDFCVSVSSKASEIHETLKTSGKDPTEGPGSQTEAIANMTSGVDAWHSKTDMASTFGEGLADDKPQPKADPTPDEGKKDDPK